MYYTGLVSVVTLAYQLPIYVLFLRSIVRTS